MKNSPLRAFVLALTTATAALGWIPMETGVWPDGQVSLAFEFTTRASQSGLAWSTAAASALAAWNSSLHRIQLVRGETSGSPGYDNGRNELFFSKSAYDEPFPDGVLAVTLITTENDHPVETDVVFNASENWSVYTGKLASSPIDFQRVALHELGHVLGLDHPDEAGQRVSAIMNSVASDIDAPTADDQAGARGLYDSGPGAAPVILAGGTSPMVDAGEAAEFHVVVGGRGPFTYVWKHDGVVIPGATTATLAWPVVANADRGQYTVTVSNAAGSVGASFTLSVNPASPPFMWWPAVITGVATVGEDFTLRMGTISGSFPFVYEWRRDGVLLGPGDGQSYTVRDAQFSDAGGYTLTLRNYAGEYTSAPFRLSVVPRMAPRFTRDLASRSIPAGHYPTLTPVVTGSPPLTYLWRKNDAILANESDSTLTLENFSAADAGVYTLTVRNAYGEATSEPCTLTTLATKPIITSQSAPVSEYAGASINLSVNATWIGSVAFQWYKDGVPLASAAGPTDHLVGTSQSRLYVRQITAADAGFYTVDVVSGGGVTSSAPIHVDVLPPEKPLITYQPTPHTILAGAKVLLDVGVRPAFTPRFMGATAGLSYQWFKDGQPVAGQTSRSWEFTAQTADAGRYFVRVSSAGGTTDSDAIDVEIKTTKPLITRQIPSQLFDPSDGEAMRLSAIAFEVMLRRISQDAGFTGTYHIENSSGQPVASIFYGLKVSPGTYTLVATQDGVTERSKPFTYGNQPPLIPVIYSHPASAAVDEGQSVSLGVGATGYSPLTYQWSKNGTPIPGATDNAIYFPSFTSADAGTYRVTVTDTAGATLSEPATLALRDPNPPVFTLHPASVTAVPGEAATFETTAVGDALRYQWSKDGTPLPGATAATYSLPQVSAADAGAYTVTIANGTSQLTSHAARLTILAAGSAPLITRQPADTAARIDGEVVLTVTADATPPPTDFQWRKNGVDLPGATDCELRLHKITTADAGTYAVVVRNDAGAVTSRAATLTVDPSARLVNLSSRARIGVGDDVLISGFVVTGAQPRSLLVRGVGDQLRDYGVPRVLRNPLLKIFDAKGRLVTSNDNWTPSEPTALQALTAAAATVGAFPLQRDTADAALLTTLDPGVYTAIVSGVADTGGVALVEIYELGSPSDDRLVNLSSRAFVGAGDDLLIAGLVLRGGTSHRILVRGVGPGLSGAGIKNYLADPVLQLHRGDSIVATNDNWADGGGDAIRTTAGAVGAFPLTAGSRDAALLLDLAAGVYSVHVFGADGGTGIALLEIYEVPP